MEWTSFIERLCYLLATEKKLGSGESGVLGGPAELALVSPLLTASPAGERSGLSAGQG